MAATMNESTVVAKYILFLTGFDAITLNTLGNIVCFRNLEQEMNDAVVLFGNKDIVLLTSHRIIAGEDSVWQKSK